MNLPILQPSPSETLAEKCTRLALQIEDYERDILTDFSASLNLTEIRVTLQAAAEAMTR